MSSWVAQRPRRVSPQAAGEWEVAEVVAGIRASGPRTHLGALPVAGCVPGSRGRWWVLTGLGARGLVWHSLLAAEVADAMLAGSDEGLPAEVRAWKEAPAWRAEPGPHATLA